MQPLPVAGWPPLRHRAESPSDDFRVGIDGGSRLRSTAKRLGLDAAAATPKMKKGAAVQSVAP